MNNLIAQLYVLSADRSPIYEALCDSLKAFDTGLFPMFTFSEEDINHSREHGDMPEGAQPLGMELAFAPLSSRSQGDVHPPWLIAKRLRAIADSLDSMAETEMERWYEQQRLTSRESFGVGDGDIRQFEILEARQDMLEKAVKVWAEWPGDSTDAQLIEFCGFLLDKGVSLPVIESEQDLDPVTERLADILQSELERVSARVERVKTVGIQPKPEEDDEPPAIPG